MLLSFCFWYSKKKGLLVMLGPWELQKVTVLNLSLKQHSANQQLYCHLPPITQTKYDGQDMLATAGEVRTKSHGYVSVSGLTKIYVHQLCMDTG